MQIIYVNAVHSAILQQKITACIGYFDGLHKGHQALIAKVMQISKEDGTIPALITFEPDPWTVLKNIKNPPHILSPDYRNQIMEELRIEICIILQFDQTMADLEINQFHELLYGLQVKTLVCGFDFHYGKQGKGSVTSLTKQKMFQVEVIDKVEDHEEKISSSRIERLLTHGQVEEASNLLGRPYRVSGRIIKGNQLGRAYGFPTANLQLDYAYICPKCGVYIGACGWRDKIYPAIINIGHNPTFNFQQTIAYEAHILDFQENLYGETSTFYFYKFIREEKKFASKQALIEQLQLDRQCTLAYFKEEKENL